MGVKNRGMFHVKHTAEMSVGGIDPDRAGGNRNGNLSAAQLCLLAGESIQQGLQILKFEAADMPLPRTHMSSVHQGMIRNRTSLGGCRQGSQRTTGDPEG